MGRSCASPVSTAAFSLSCIIFLASSTILRATNPAQSVSIGATPQEFCYYTEIVDIVHGRGEPNAGEAGPRRLSQSPIAAPALVCCCRCEKSFPRRL